MTGVRHTSGSLYNWIVVEMTRRSQLATQETHLCCLGIVTELPPDGSSAFHEMVSCEGQSVCTVAVVFQWKQQASVPRKHSVSFVCGTVEVGEDTFVSTFFALQSKMFLKSIHPLSTPHNRRLNGSL